MVDLDRKTSCVQSKLKTKHSQFKHGSGLSFFEIPGILTETLLRFENQKISIMRRYALAATQGKIEQFRNIWNIVLIYPGAGE